MRCLRRALCVLLACGACTPLGWNAREDAQEAGPDPLWDRTWQEREAHRNAPPAAAVLDWLFGSDA